MLDHLQGCLSGHFDVGLDVAVRVRGPHRARARRACLSSSLSAPRAQEGDDLHVLGHREDIEGAAARRGPNPHRAGRGRRGERGRIARHVDDAVQPWCVRGEGGHDRRAGPLPCRIEDDGRAGRSPPPPAQASPCPRARGRAPASPLPLCRASAQARRSLLDGQDGARGADRLGQGDGEETGPGVEVGDVLAGDGPRQREDRLEECRGGPRMDLPEHTSRDAIRVTVHDRIHGPGRSPERAAAEQGRRRPPAPPLWSARGGAR